MDETGSRSMLSTNGMASAFAVNGNAIGRHSEGLSHADSLLDPGNGANSLNWLLGHILAYRDTTIGMLGGEKVFAEGALARYAAGSDPVTGDGDGVLRLEELLEGVATSQERLAMAFSEVTDEQLAADPPSNYADTVSGLVHFLFWHETYHVGQTEPARAVAGKTS